MLHFVLISHPLGPLTQLQLKVPEARSLRGRLLADPFKSRQRDRTHKRCRQRLRPLLPSESYRQFLLLFRSPFLIKETISCRVVEAEDFRMKPPDSSGGADDLAEIFAESQITSIQFHCTSKSRFDAPLSRLANQVSRNSTGFFMSRN